MTATEFNNQVMAQIEHLKPVAMNLTRDPEDANDLTQETLYKALSNRDKFKAGTNLNAWLYTIMKNIFINEYRRQKKRNATVESTEDFGFLESLEKNQGNEGESGMNLKDIHRALNKLSSFYSYPFLKHFEGYKYDEIAEELALPIGTVKSRIHLARKKLQKQLKPFRLLNKV